MLKPLAHPTTDRVDAGVTRARWRTPWRQCAALAVSLLQVACATSNPAEQWWLNGRSQAQFEADLARCRLIAADAIDDGKVKSAGEGIARGGGMAALGGLLAAAEWAQSQGVLNRCMQSRGYVQRR